MQSPDPGEIRFEIHQVIKPVDQLAHARFAAHQFEGRRLCGGDFVVKIAHTQ